MQKHIKNSELYSIIKETALQMQKNSQAWEYRMKQTDKKIKELSELFTGQWGKLVESLVEGGLLKALKSRNIYLTKTHTNINNYAQSREIDILATNGEEVVVVEVKTTLRLKDIKKFLQKIQYFKQDYPEYQTWKVYGAIAFIKANDKVRQYAEEEGLFVIHATGNSSAVMNTPHFKPKRLGLHP